MKEVECPNCPNAHAHHVHFVDIDISTESMNRYYPRKDGSVSIHLKCEGCGLTFTHCYYSRKGQIIFEKTKKGSL